jgi:HSP20 family protein
MAPFIFYEPFYFEIERILNDPSLLKQDRKSGAVRSFKPRQVLVPGIFIYAFFILNTEYRLDLHEDTEKNVVTATFEFPGFSKVEVEINFQNGKLTVSAETTKKSEHSTNADTGHTLNERLHGKFSRILLLPQGVQVCLNLLE